MLNKIETKKMSKNVKLRINLNHNIYTRGSQVNNNNRYVVYKVDTKNRNLPAELDSSGFLLPLVWCQIFLLSKEAQTKKTLQPFRAFCLVKKVKKEEKNNNKQQIQVSTVVRNNFPP